MQLLDELAEYRAVAPADARALPPRAYADGDFFGLEQAHIFAREWICVGRADRLAHAGDHLALTIAGEPVLVVRGEDGALRALANVCRHRLYPLAPEGFGHAAQLTCQYHRWTYRLDGTLAAAPHMQDVGGFDRAACRLPEFRVETWLGFVFVNLDTRAAPLQPRVAAQEARFARHDVAAAVAVADYHAVWQGNWKLAVENASESYHHMGLHRATIEPYMPARGTFATAATDHYAEHVTPIVEAVAREYGIAYDTPTRLTAEDRAAMKVVTVFPNFVLLTVGDVVNWLVFTPLAVDRTEVRAGFLLPPAALAVEPDVAALRAGMQQSLETINGEDEQATALQQKAATSRFAARGALSPREAVLPQFYRYLARMLAPAEG